jgi:hypothetical protein
MLRNKHIIPKLVDDGRYDDGQVRYEYGQSARADVVGLMAMHIDSMCHICMVRSCDIKMNGLCSSRYAITPATEVNLWFFVRASDRSC